MQLAILHVRHQEAGKDIGKKTGCMAAKVAIKVKAEHKAGKPGHKAVQESTGIPLDGHSASVGAHMGTEGKS